MKLNVIVFSVILVVGVVAGLVAAVNAAQPALTIRQAQGECAAVTPINEFANLRSSPALADNITGQLKRGQVAVIESTPGNLWYKTSLGYVHSSVVVCAELPTTTPTATATPVQPTPTRLPSLTPTPVVSYSVILRVCIIYSASNESVCSLFTEPVAVTIERMP